MEWLVLADTGDPCQTLEKATILIFKGTGRTGLLAPCGLVRMFVSGVCSCCLVGFGYCRNFRGATTECKRRGAGFSRFLQLVLGEGESQATEELCGCIKKMTLCRRIGTFRRETWMALVHSTTCRMVSGLCLKPQKNGRGRICDVHRK